MSRIIAWIAGAACALGAPPGALAADPAASAAPEVIDALQPGQWLELQDTRIRSVLPDPVPRGHAPYLISAWSGGAVDVTRHRLLVWGGGHADYWGNEMYALELSDLTIRRIVEPSPFASSATCTPALPDGTPTARHTYDGLAYIAHADLLFSIHGGLAPCGQVDQTLWTFDFTARRWRQAPGATIRSSVGTMAVYDAATRQVFIKDTSDFYAYSPQTQAVAKLNKTPMPVDYHLSADIDTKRRKFVMIGNGVQVIDLATRAMSTLQTFDAPSLVTSKQSPGVAYDPVADRLVAWHGGRDVWALDLDSRRWSQVANSPGPTASAPWQGTFGRWGYVPGYRVFALINDIDQNAWVFRLAK